MGHCCLYWLWPSQPSELGQVVSHLLAEFQLLIQEVVFQQVTEVRVCAGRIQGMQVQEGLIRVFLQAASMASWILSHSS